MKKIGYERSKNDSTGYYYFGEMDNSNNWDGLGLIKWDYNKDNPDAYLYAFGEYKNNHRSGFAIAIGSEEFNISTNIDGWKRKGLCASLYRTSLEFYYRNDQINIGRGFFFTKDSDILKVKTYNEKGEATSTTKYRLPFTFKLNTAECNDIWDKNYPVYYKNDSEGVNILAEGKSIRNTPYLSYKKYSNGIHFGVFENDAAKGFGVYHFTKTNDYVIGRFDGIYNHSQVFYTYDGGNSLRFGAFKNEEWDGWIIEVDDDQVLTLYKMENGKTLESLKIANLNKIGEENDPIVPPTNNLNLFENLFKNDGNKPSDIIKDIPTPNPEVVETKPSAPKRKLEDLVGLTEVKKQIKRFAAYAKKNKDKVGSTNFHMVFTGNPGTGKTEVGRLIADLLHNAGVLPTNKLVETDRSGLIAGYIGQTATKVMEKVEEAIGGVLFIDEAYSLFTEGDDGKDFGHEAVATLLKAMEDRRGEFVVILAGYQDEMEKLLTSNPGLYSRIGFKFHFPNYTKDELKLIGLQMLGDLQYKIDDNAMDLLLDIVCSKSYEKSFANAREIRNVLHHVVMIQNERTSDSDSNLIVLEDVETYAKEHNYLLCEKGQDIAGSSMNKVVGLENVKKQIKRIEAYVRKNKGCPNINLHMCFTGNPGTGKTMIARMFGNILFRAGLLTSNKFIEVDRTDLVGKYIGQTESKTKEIIDKAMGGVLFIDEAYSLSAGGENDYGSQAVSVLVKEMEDHNGDFCVIFAGYEREMRQFIRMNSGLSSRVQFFIDFPDYTEEELEQIAALMISKEGYLSSENVTKEIAKYTYMQKGYREYANARTVRNMVTGIIMTQNQRTIENDDREIALEDVRTYCEEIGLCDKKEVTTEIEPISYDTVKKLSDEWDSKNFAFDKKDIDERVVYILTTSNEGSQSEGSGFIISPDGYFLTCHHCIDNYKSLSVRVSYYTRTNKRIYQHYDAVVVSSSKEHDVALCKITNLDGEVPYMPLSFEPVDTTKDNSVVLAGYPHGLRRVNEVSFYEGKIISQQHNGSDDKIYIDIMGKSGCSGSGVFYRETGKVVGVFCGAMLNHRQELTEEMNFIKPISHGIDLFKK